MCVCECVCACVSACLACMCMRACMYISTTKLLIFNTSTTNW